MWNEIGLSGATEINSFLPIHRRVLDMTGFTALLVSDSGVRSTSFTTQP